ncbi:MAG: hydantoinase B/oxoprolinase family protein [Firmicutes bacterium]|nr:hydantoinase B/oxoprolinase family protein [Bacillota bacterium]
MGVSQDLSPIVTEILRSALVAITDEMKTNLMRTAHNMIIYEALDFTVGLFDEGGNTVSIGLGLPMFIRGLSDTIKAMLAHYGRDGIEPGDLLLTNDAYIHGSHLNHMVFALPVFWEGELVGFAASMAHWQDVGGTLSGVTTDIYSEGLQLPIVKIHKAGREDRELIAIICHNVRFPDAALGDLRAQVAAVKTGERRWHQLLARYGLTTVRGGIRAIMAHSERLARATVAAMPDGTYEASAFMDDDGVTAGHHIPIRVRVVVAGDRLTVDLSDMSPQVAGYYNAGKTAGRSAAQVAFKCLTTPLDFPINDGAFRPLEVILPEGRVVSAVRPAAMRWWMTIPMTVVDTIFKALAPAMAEATIAGHHADLLATSIYGVDPRSGRFYVSAGSLPGGGWGARQDADGMSATVCINDGDTHNTPVEATEVRFPVIVERYALRPDSGGAGRHRGGLGTVQIRRMRAPASLNSQVERTQCPPWGLFGGKDGLPNRLSRIDREGREHFFANGKANSVPLEAGEAYAIYAGGGGGFGDPQERPVEAVLHDVVEGYVSPEAARREYGVAVRPSEEGWAVDWEETARLRAPAPQR